MSLVYTLVIYFLLIMENRQELYSIQGQSQVHSLWTRTNRMSVRQKSVQTVELNINVSFLANHVNPSFPLTCFSSFGNNFFFTYYPAPLLENEYQVDTVIL